MSLLNGLSAMGTAVANTAGTAAIEQQKSNLEEEKLTLASHLSGQDIDVQSKRLSLLPQALSADAYLKATGHPGGLSDFGMQVPGQGSAPSSSAVPGPANDTGSPQSSDTAATPTRVADSGDSSKASASGAAPTTGKGAAPSSDGRAAFPNGAPIVTPMGDKGKILGLALPPGWTIQQAAIAGPTALAAAWAEWAKPQNVRQNSAITYYDFATGQQKSLYQQPDAPQGTLFDPSTKSFVKVGNADAAIQGAAFDKSKGESAGSLGADLTKIGAQGGQARKTAEFQKGLDVGTNLVDSYDPVTQTTTKITQADALKRTSGGNGVIAPPVTGAAAASAGGPGLQQDGSYRSPTGTIIPAPPKPVKGANGLQAKPSAADEATQASYAPIIKGWQESITPSVMAEQRFQAIAEAMKATQTGAWQNTKQDIAHHLMSYGIIDPETADKLLGANVADAQIILKNNFGTALNTLSAARLGRITQNEIFAMQKNLPAMGNQPEANLAMIAQGIGTARYQESLARDWNSARQLGYADPLTYEAAWTKANPLQGFVDQAKKEIGPLKGMPTPYPAPPTAAVQELKMRGPKASAQFDAIFGPGAADKAMGTK